MCEFENNIVKFFKQQNIILSSEKKYENFRIGVAVSGGADSVSLLTALCNIFTPLQIPLYVITVNHFIRPDEETCGDVLFVQELCSSLKTDGYLIECTVHNLKKGQVFSVAEERKCGIEEAARTLRYEAFETFILEKQLNFLCLAHNKNDNLETLLMRFLNGSSTEGLRGIENKRNKYLRPLSGITRKEIEEYLTSKNISWRTDSTNSDTNYLRNKIRLKLIPFLNENFQNWENGLLRTAEYMNQDFKIIESLEIDFLHKFWNQNDNSIAADEFFKLESGLQKRVLFALCNHVSKKNRISSHFIEQFCLEMKLSKKSKVVKQFLDMKFIYEENKVLVRKAGKIQTDLCFFDIIEEDGKYEFPFGCLEVLKSGNCYFFTFEGINKTEIKVSNLPVCVRNAQLNDEILCKDKNYKKISDIYSNWHVSMDDKVLIPLIQELATNRQDIICIVGSVLDYPDWIVRNN